MVIVVRFAREREEEDCPACRFSSRDCFTNSDEEEEVAVCRCGLDVPLGFKACVLDEIEKVDIVNPLLLKRGRDYSRQQLIV